MTLEGTLENQQGGGRHTVGTTGHKTGQAHHKQKNAQKIRSTQMVLMHKNEQSAQQSHSWRLRCEPAVGDYLHVQGLVQRFHL